MNDQASSPKCKCVWLRISMWTLIALLTVGSLWLGWIANRARKQRDAFETIRGLGAETQVSLNLPPASITGVSVAKNKRRLVIRYERSGRADERTVAFTDDIIDFRYCRWLGDLGVAVVASTVTDEFYFATLYLTGHDDPVPSTKIPAPGSKSQLLGIANTGGDSIVITAAQHRRDGPDLRHYGPDQLTGWMFINNCPRIGATGGFVIPFDIPVEQSK